MTDRPIPRGLREVPVPEGVFIGSIEERLDRLLSACTGEMISPADDSLVRLQKAWNDFPKSDQEFLGFRRYFARGARIDFFARIMPKRAKPKREALVIEIMRAASRMRADLTFGRRRRPKHVNPPTMLVAG